MTFLEALSSWLQLSKKKEFPIIFLVVRTIIAWYLLIVCGILQLRRICLSKSVYIEICLSLISPGIVLILSKRFWENLKIPKSKCANCIVRTVWWYVIIHCAYFIVFLLLDIYFVMSVLCIWKLKKKKEREDTCHVAIFSYLSSHKKCRAKCLPVASCMIYQRWPEICFQLAHYVTVLYGKPSTSAAQSWFYNSCF